MEEKSKCDTNVLFSITDDNEDIILLDSLITLDDLEQINKRFLLDNLQIFTLNKSQIYNDFLEIHYTRNLQTGGIFSKIINNVKDNYHLPTIVIQNKSLPLFSSPENALILEYKSTPELVMLVQCLDSFLNKYEGKCGLVIIDKFNYFYRKNVYIDISDDYYNAEHRVKPKILIKKPNPLKPAAKNPSRSSTLKQTEFGLIESVILNAVRHQMRYNFNLIVTQYDFRREKFLSSLRYYPENCLKSTFYESNFFYQNNSAYQNVYQFISPEEEHVDHTSTLILKKEQNMINLIYMDDFGEGGRIEKKSI